MDLATEVTPAGVTVVYVPISRKSYPLPSFFADTVIGSVHSGVMKARESLSTFSLLRPISALDVQVETMPDTPSSSRTPRERRRLMPSISYLVVSLLLLV